MYFCKNTDRYPLNGLQYEIKGEINNPKIVLIHGWPDNISVWDQQVDLLLKANYCLILFKLPGYFKNTNKNIHYNSWGYTGKQLAIAIDYTKKSKKNKNLSNF